LSEHLNYDRLLKVPLGVALAEWSWYQAGNLTVRVSILHRQATFDPRLPKISNIHSLSMPLMIKFAKHTLKANRCPSSQYYLFFVKWKYFFVTFFERLSMIVKYIL